MLHLTGAAVTGRSGTQKLIETEKIKDYLRPLEIKPSPSLGSGESFLEIKLLLNYLTQLRSFKHPKLSVLALMTPSPLKVTA